jgi:hypothetical protein
MYNLAFKKRLNKTMSLIGYLCCETIEYKERAPLCITIDNVNFYINEDSGYNRDLLVKTADMSLIRENVNVTEPQGAILHKFITHVKHVFQPFQVEYFPLYRYVMQ